jgi:hypothetical protein
MARGIEKKANIRKQFCFRVVLKASAYKMLPILCSFSVISIETFAKCSIFKSLVLSFEGI